MCCALGEMTAESLALCLCFVGKLAIAGPGDLLLSPYLTTVAAFFYCIRLFRK